MIRQSSSFFISLTIHSLVAILLFYTYKNVVSFKSDKNEKVKLKLSSIIQEKEVPKLIQKPKKIVKPVPKKAKQIYAKPIKKTIPVVKEKVKEQKIVEEIKEVKEVVESQEEVQITHEKNIADEELNPEAEYLDENIRLITQLIQENLHYPRSARKRGITGKVVVEFVLSLDSSVKNVKINYSQKDILSRAAVKTIKDLSGKFPKPKQNLKLKVPIIYSLSH